MKLRNIVISFIFILLGSLTLSQAVSAQVQSMGPVSGPITKPITGPVTSPITHLIKGKITYRILGRIIIPAKDVKVTGTNIKTDEQSYTISDSKGEYSLKLKDATYNIVPQDKFKTIFRPSYIRIKVDRDQKGLDFQGTR